MRRILMGAGTAALVAGMLAAAFGVFDAGGTAHAGETSVPPCDSTATPVDTATPTGTSTVVLTMNEVESNPQFVSLGNGIPTCTPTQSVPRTHTPTPTGTPEDTVTPGPTNTAAPDPSPTSPSGEPGGGGVEPPDTGFGPEGEGGMNYWFVLAGATLVALGAGSVALGLRRR